MARSFDARWISRWSGMDRDLLRQQHHLPNSAYWSLEYGYWLRFYRWGLHPGDKVALIYPF